MVRTDSLNVIHRCAAGLDVHKMQITATVLIARADAEAQTHTQQFEALPEGLEKLSNWLLGFGVTAAAMEATGIYWLSVYETLEKAGIRPLVFNAQHVKQIKGRKTDVADSLWLARICQFGLGAPSFVPPAAFRDLRDLSHKRRKIAQDRSRLRTRVHQILDRAGIRVGGILSDLFGVNGMRLLEGLVAGTPPDRIIAGLSGHVRSHRAALRDALNAELTSSARFMLEDHLASWHSITQRLERYDRLIEKALADHATQLDLLTTMPGVDRTAAAAILIELGPDMSVFASHYHCAAWAGLCPGNNESAGKRRSGRARKGNAHLRSILIECAHAAARTKDCQFKSYHAGLKVRRGYKRATVATAHKMLRAIYHMLKNGELYRDPETDYEALMVRRNAPRWIRMMRKHGVSPTPEAPALAA